MLEQITKTVYFIPEKMKSYDSWVCYKLEKRNDELSKVPKNPKNPKYNASSTNSDTWASFSKAQETLKNRPSMVDGIGFAISEDSSFTGIDFDHCVDAEGNLSDVAKTVIDCIHEKAYIELSPSGTGIHAIVEGSIPKSFNNRKLGIEMYHGGGRYLTITGNAIFPNEPQNAQHELDALFERYSPKKKTKEKNRGRPQPHSEVCDSHLLDIARRNERTGRKFSDLYDAGNFGSYYESQSEADLWICGQLAFLTDKDERRIDTLFRQSALFRDKWNENHGGQSYGEMTITKAVDGCDESLSEFKERKDSERTLTIKETELNFESGLPPSEVASLLDEGKGGGVLKSRKNMQFVFNNDENLKDIFRFNELSYSIFVCGNPTWQHPSNYYEMRNVDLDYVQNYFEDIYSLTGEKKIISVLNTVAQNHVFNPLTEFLEGLPEWDGKNHVCNLLPDFLGVKRTPLNEEMMMLWMLGAVNRAYKPGCKFDYVLILLGEQGVGKSYFLSQLAMNPTWFCDNLQTIEGSKGCEMLRGMWILEMAELLCVKRQQSVEGFKAFITSRIDNFRTPYARLTESHPRRCVFAGTTNEKNFLTDTSGNRRFLPLEVHSEGIKHSMFDEPELFRAEIRQAWAEVLHIFKTESRQLVLSRESETMLNAIRNGEYTEEDWRVGVIEEYLYRHAEVKADKSLTVCTATIYYEALQLMDDKQKPLDKKTSREISTILRQLGCEEVGIKTLNPYGRQRGYKYTISECNKVSAETATKSEPLQQNCGFEEISDDEYFDF